MSNEFTNESRQRLLEAHERARQSRRRNFEERVRTYLADPKLCLNCEKPLGWNQRDYKYCSRSCSVTVANTGIRRHGNAPHPCPRCSIMTANRKHCSSACALSAREEMLSHRIESGSFKNPAAGQTIRKYLVRKRGYRCESCGLTDWLGSPVPLNTHHEDGDATNNLPSNLKLLCLNCHGLTHNYGSKNSQSTRTYRYGRKTNGEER